MSSTREVLASMFQEKAEYATMEASIWGGDLDITVRVDTFQWLAERLEFDPVLQAEFDAWVTDPENDRQHSAHYADMEEWVQARFPECGDGIYGDQPGATSVNTYNHESVLDEVIQFVAFTPEEHEYEDGMGDTFVLLQAHRGGDVRGNYTAAKVFRVCGNCEYAMFEDTDVPSLFAKGEDPGMNPLPGIKPPPTETTWYHDGETWELDIGGVYLSEYEATEDPERRGKGAVYVDDDGKAYCPITGGELKC